MLLYIDLRLRGLIGSVKTGESDSRVTLELREWQNLVDLQDRLAGYLVQIGEPGV